MTWNPKTWTSKWMNGKERWIIMLAVGLIFLILALPGGRGQGNGGRTGGQTEAEKQQDGTGQGNDNLYGNGEVTEGAGGMVGMSAGIAGGTQPWSTGAGGAQLGEPAGTSSGGTGGNGNTFGSSTAGQASTAAGQASTATGQASSAADQASFAAGQASTAAGQASTAAASAVPLTYEQQLEKRLEDILGQVDGVGKVNVMIVLKSSEEKIWHVDRNTSSSSTAETDSGGGSRQVESQELSENTVLTGQSSVQGPLLEKELRPEISGVIVSAAGGGNPQIQAEIISAVEALFGLPAHKIKVLKMK